TPVTYSILILDPYGNVFDNLIPSQTPGTYALAGPGFSGTLPNGVSPVQMPLNATTLIFRADKYTPSGANQIPQAEAIRRSLTMETLPDYTTTPAGGATSILPEIEFALSFKVAADTLIANDPIEFLRELKRAVASSRTPPLTPALQVLSDRF